MGIDAAVVGMALFVGVFYAGLFLLVGGLLRIPWRYAVQVALGGGMVVLAAVIADHTRAGGPLIFLAAIGAILATSAYERGKARRDEAIREILRPH